MATAAARSRIGFSIDSIVGSDRLEGEAKGEDHSSGLRLLQGGPSPSPPLAPPPQGKGTVAADLVDLRKTCSFNSRVNPPPVPLEHSSTPPGALLLPPPNDHDPAEAAYFERLGAAAPHGRLLPSAQDKFPFAEVLVGPGAFPGHGQPYPGYPLPTFPSPAGFLIPPAMGYGAVNLPGMLVRAPQFPHSREYPLWLLSRQGRIFTHPLAAQPPGFLLQPFRKPKRIRTAFSPGQLLKLEQAFEKNHYVVGTERKQLADNLGLSETQVKVWFQNRRTKHKRVQQEENDARPTTSGQKSSSPVGYDDEKEDELGGALSDNV